MGRGEVEVFNPLLGGAEPPLPLRGDAVFQHSQRGGGDQIAAVGKHGDGHQGLPAGVVQQLQVPGDVLLCQVRVLDDPVIGGVRNPHHLPQAGVQVQVHLGQHPLAVLHQKGVVGGGEPQKQRQSQKDHAHHGHSGEKQGQNHLDAGAVIELPPAPAQGHGQSRHRRASSPEIFVCGSAGLYSAPARYLVGVTPKCFLNT